MLQKKMVAENVNMTTLNGIIHIEENTKVFLEDSEYGIGNLHITENDVYWDSATDDKHIRIQYPSISLHAISRNPSTFLHECIYCLLESTGATESEENDAESDVTQIRFVPAEKENLKKIYDAIAYGQTLHPDEDIMGSEEEMEDEERSNYDTIQDGTEAQQLLDGHFYTADTNVADMQLSEEGQAVLERLQRNMIISNGEETPNQPNGQFEDADEVE